MPSVYDLKPRFQALLRPIMHRLRRAGVTPNGLTWMAIGLSFVTGACIGLAIRHPGLLLLVPPALFSRMALNALDGMMARECRMTSPRGMILNELGDIVSDTVTFVPMVVHVDRGGSVIVLFAFLAVLCEFSGLLGVSLCGERRYDGPMGKSDRAFAVGAISLALYLAPATRHALVPCFLVLSGLLLVSISNRLRSALIRVGAPPHA